MNYNNSKYGLIPNIDVTIASNNAMAALTEAATIAPMGGAIIAAIKQPKI